MRLNKKTAGIARPSPRIRASILLDVTLRLGVDAVGDGWRYRGRVIKAGAPFTLTTERYVAEGVVLDVGTGQDDRRK